MENIFKTIIVPASCLNDIKAICEEGMFTTGLSESGNNPPTHYISTGYVTEDVFTGNEKIDVSDEIASVALERLNLKLITDEIN